MRDIYKVERCAETDILWDKEAFDENIREIYESARSDDWFQRCCIPSEYSQYLIMLYQFKQEPEDFIVEELLSEYPSGKGDVFYVYFEKRNLTTMEVLTSLQDSLALQREDLGIA